MKVHELIDKPEKWLKGIVASTEYATENHLAKPDTGIGVATRPDAKSFCLYGGLVRVNGGHTEEVDRELDRIYRIVGNNAICWNNSPDLTFEEFHRVLVEADV